MADDVTLKAVLLGEDRSASKAIKGVGDAAEDTTSKLKSGWADAGAVMSGVLAADIIKRGTQELWDFGKASVEAFRDAARSQRELDDAYARFPALADVHIDKMRELNQAIQDKTGADADDIAASQAVLARHKLTGDQIARLTPLLVDYARRTGTDLPAAGDKLGKALAGNARAMKELGIPFENTGTAAGNFDQILTGLQEKVGGFAEGEAQTLDGKLVMLETRFGDVQEAVGEALLPVLVQLSDGLLAVVGYVQENADWLGPLAVALGAGAAAVGTIIGVTKAWAVAQAALNIVLTANPIGLVAMAIGALVAGLVWAYQESETFRAVVDAAFGGVAAAGQWLWNNALQPVLQFLVRGFSQASLAVWALLDQLGNVPGFEWAKTAANELYAMAEKADEVADGITKIPDQTTVDTGDTATDLDKVASSADGAGDSLDGLEESAERVADAQGKVAKSAEDVARGLLGLRGDTRSLEAAYDDATAAAKKNGRTLDENTAAGRANQEVLDRIASAALSVKSGMEEAGKSTKDINGEMDRARSKFISSATSMGMSKKAAKELADDLGLVSSKAKKAGDAVKAIPTKKTVNVLIKVGGDKGIKTVYSAGGGVKFSGYDKGGRPKVGELALFHADELWVPDTAGTVLTKRQTASLIGSGPSPIASAGGTTIVQEGDTIHIDVRGVLTEGEAGRAIDRALTSHKRRVRRLDFEGVR